MAVFRCTHCGKLNRLAGAAPSGKSPVCGGCREPLDGSGAPQEVDAAGLARAVRDSPIPVLVDFWAPWCGPCRMMAPLLDGLARRRAGELLVLKLNSDREPRASAEHEVLGIPTLILFRDGREVARQVGAVPAPALERWIEPQIRRAS